MLPLIAEGADAELDAVTPVAEFDAGVNTYPYLRLTADYFEVLAYGLFKSSRPAGYRRIWDDATLMPRGADRGRDLVLKKDGQVVGVVQCKRLENAISLPAVFREVAKLVLYPEADGGLHCIAAGETYLLMVAKDPSNKVVEFFDRPGEVLRDRQADVGAAVRDVLETYEALSSLAEEAALETVMSVMPMLDYRLLRPADLDSWLAAEPKTAARFFRHRVMVDNSAMEKEVAELRAQVERMSRQVEGVPLLTDVDLKIIKEHIEGTPESHRVAVGFASCFGYPREMFTGNENLSRRVGLLAQLGTELNLEYVDWMFARSREEAFRIMGSVEVQATVPPYARQMASIFLGLVAYDIVGKAVSGEAMNDFATKLSGRKKYADDDARLADVCQDLVEHGREYLRGNFSDLVGEGEFLARKTRLFQWMIRGIDDEPALERAVREAEATLRPQLYAAASRLRELCARSPGIFIMGTVGLDNPAMVARMAETARALEALGKGSAPRADE